MFEYHWHTICLIKQYVMHLICKTFVVRVIINQSICDCIIHSCLDEHLALRARLDGGAVHRHGLAVTRELQGELLLHQLSDYLMDEKDGEKSRKYVSQEEEMENKKVTKSPGAALSSCIRGQLSGWQPVGD